MQNEDQEVFGFWDHVTDGLAGGIRGIAAAGASVYDLGDTIYTGTVGKLFEDGSPFESLPDLPHQRDTFLGESKTLTGNIVEGITQFATAFIPVAGWVNKGAHLGGVQLAKGIAGSPLAKTAVSGAAADFIGFDGQEARLSNLLLEFPTLRGPVTEYLAASPDDGEIEGRFKNSLEGLGLGAMVDVLAIPLKALRKYRGAVDKGVEPEKALKEIGNELGTEEARRRVIVATEQEFELIKAQLAEQPEEAIKNMGFTDETFRDLLEKTSDRAGELAGLDPINPRVDIQEAIQQKIDRGEINLKAFPASAAMEFARALSEKLEVSISDFVVNNKKRVSLDKNFKDGVELLANAAGMGPDAYEVMLRQRSAALVDDTRVLAKMQADVSAGQIVYKILAEQVKDLDARIKLTPASVTDDELVEGMLSAEQFFRITAGLQGVATGTGRLMRQFGGPAKVLTKAQLDDIFISAGGKDNAAKIVGKLAEVLKSPQGGAAGAAKAGRHLHLGLEMTLEYWMNNVLSGVKTHSVNFLGNAGTTFYRPFEYMLGGAAGTVFGSNKAAARRTFTAGAKTYLHLMTNIKEALTYAKVSFDAGPQGVQQGGKFAGSTSGRPLSENLGELLKGDPAAFAESALRGPVDFIGKLLNLPTRLLETSDIFFKQLNDRATLQTELYFEGLDLKLSKKDAAEYAQTKKDWYYENGQRKTQHDAIREGIRAANKTGLEKGSLEYNRVVMRTARQLFNPDAAERALYAAQESTHTLPQTGLTKSLQKLTAKHPYLKFIIPFINVPTNIVKFAGRRIDVMGLSAAKIAQNHPDFRLFENVHNWNNQVVKDIFSDDPRRAYEAAGRLMSGFAVTSFFIGMAAQGHITGAGPKDRNHRLLLEGSGWTPYSIKIGDKWVTYQRADPLAILMGMAADTVLYGQYTDEDEGQGTAAMLMGIVGAVSKSITNKSYLTGISNLSNLISDPERHGEAGVANLLGGFVPWASFWNQAEDAYDPILRDARSLQQRLLSRVPGLSDDLPAVRNILGEKVTKLPSIFAEDDEVGINFPNFFIPIQYRAVKDDFIFDELNKVGHGFTPPVRTTGGIDLSTVKASGGGANAYDRYQELVGQISINNSTLKQSLKRLFKSDDYKKLSDVGIGEEDSDKVRAIRAVLSRYRRHAFNQLVTEVPELQEIQRQKQAARLGFSPYLLQ